MRKLWCWWLTGVRDGAPAKLQVTAIEDEALLGWRCSMLLVSGMGEGAASSRSSQNGGEGGGALRQ